MDPYSTLDHATLYRLRREAQDRELQNLLAGYEHRAFAREATADNPLMGVPIALATPLYQGAKLLGLTDSRSAPSWSQMGQGLLGVGEGWAQRLLR
jgi:hypothetical protein